MFAILNYLNEIYVFSQQIQYERNADDIFWRCKLTLMESAKYDLIFTCTDIGFQSWVYRRCHVHNNLVISIETHTIQHWRRKHGRTSLWVFMSSCTIEFIIIMFLLLVVLFQIKFNHELGLIQKKLLKDCQKPKFLNQKGFLTWYQ